MKILEEVSVKVLQGQQFEPQVPHGLSISQINKLPSSFPSKKKDDECLAKEVLHLNAGIGDGYFSITWASLVLQGAFYQKLQFSPPSDPEHMLRIALFTNHSKLQTQ